MVYQRQGQRSTQNYLQWKKKYRMILYFTFLVYNNKRKKSKKSKEDDLDR
jgi:hypothetical protein